ncbi:adhesion regulating molecule [Schizopora paradoxa]|uniref:Adhesion regulating molecule n=1 Tax=Schizopora paradoxa TaxID=27342 RepID=A0A0H2S525_9AGAM|nr:adhesion regulating molecule [Schizopora paradoxa]
MSEPILAFKAGKATRREGTNTVEPSATKGAIILQNEDGLLHFKWKNRESGEVEEDLILFPQDASFTKVSQVTGGRIYVLKFNSSNQRHFDASAARDEEFASQINVLLEDPDRVLVWGESNVASTSAQVIQPTEASSSSAVGTIPPGPASAEQIAHLSEILRNMTAQQTQNRPTVSLRDVLTRENVAPLFTTHPELIPALFPHLPPDLPIPPSPEALQRVVNSPQFQEAVRSFDQALHTGLLGGLVRSLGLPEDAGTGVEPFLRAVQNQAEREGSGSSSSSTNQPHERDQDHMETD